MIHADATAARRDALERFLCRLYSVRSRERINWTVARRTDCTGDWYDARVIGQGVNGHKAVTRAVGPLEDFGAVAVGHGFRVAVDDAHGLVSALRAAVDS